MIMGSFCSICGEGTTARLCLNCTSIWCCDNVILFFVEGIFVLFWLFDFVDVSEGCVMSVNFNYNS